MIPAIASAPTAQDKFDFSSYLKEPGAVVSEQGYSVADDLESQNIEYILRNEFFYFESDMECHKKEEVLGRLKEVIKEWSTSIAVDGHNVPESLKTKYEAKLYTFGSYRLNVNTKDGDIDTVCVVPKFIDREKDFFQGLYEHLKKEPRVREIEGLQEAKIPIIKMVYDDIQIDISFARLDMQSIDDNLDLSDNNILKNMDEKSILSINGKRVADMLLESIKKETLDAFRLTLRCIKLWAKKKGIYSHKMGYLGGVSWAILVAKLCQMFPNFKTNRLLEQFFKVFSTCDWSKEVLIAPIGEELENPKEPKQWKRVTDRSKMFILTPAYPVMNSSHLVTEASLAILKKFLQEGSDTIDRINRKEAKWNDLFTGFNFASTYKDFIEVDIVGTEELEYKRWRGLVESKIGRMATHFCNQSLADIFYIHLWPDSFAKPDAEYPLSEAFFWGIKFKPEVDKKIKARTWDFFQPIKDFMGKMFTERKKILGGDIFSQKDGKVFYNINIRCFQIGTNQLSKRGYGPVEAPLQNTAKRKRTDSLTQEPKTEQKMHVSTLGEDRSLHKNMSNNKSDCYEELPDDVF